MRKEEQRRDERRGGEGAEQEREGNAALIICTRTGLLSCGGRTRPLQLWHSALPSCFHSLRPPLEPGYPPSANPSRSSPVSPSSSLAHFSADIVSARARAHGISPSRTENFNYNRNYRLFPSRKKRSFARDSNERARQLSSRSFFFSLLVQETRESTSERNAMRASSAVEISRTSKVSARLVVASSMLSIRTFLLYKLRRIYLMRIYIYIYRCLRDSLCLTTPALPSFCAPRAS